MKLIAILTTVTIASVNIGGVLALSPVRHPSSSTIACTTDQDCIDQGYGSLCTDTPQVDALISGLPIKEGQLTCAAQEKDSCYRFLGKKTPCAAGLVAKFKPSPPGIADGETCTCVKLLDTNTVATLEPGTCYKDSDCVEAKSGSVCDLQTAPYGQPGKCLAKKDESCQYFPTVGGLAAYIGCVEGTTKKIDPKAYLGPCVCEGKDATTTATTPAEATTTITADDDTMVTTTNVTPSATTTSGSGDDDLECDGEEPTVKVVYKPSKPVTTAGGVKADIGISSSASTGKNAVSLTAMAGVLGFVAVFSGVF
jgi:hypothetical protein